MSVRSTPSLLDRLLAPSTALMARLRFGQKALLIGASFTLTCAVLTAVVVVRGNAEVAAAQLQRSATGGLGHLHHAMLDMQMHEQLVVRAAAKDKVADGAVAAAAQEAQEALEAAERWQGQALPEAPMKATSPPPRPRGPRPPASTRMPPRPPPPTRPRSTRSSC